MKTSVITGATSGIGRATAFELSHRGHHIVVAGRSRDRGASLVSEIEDSGGSSEFLHLDLGSLDSVRQAAEDFINRDRLIDTMVNNAGVGRAKGLTADGFEKHFGINHLGHFLLNHLLQPVFRPVTRIVTVTSAAHKRVDGIDFDRLTLKARSIYSLDEYAVSKLANILYTAELARRQSEWNTYAVHPGLVNTKILPGWLRTLRGGRMLTPEQGAATTIFCATDPDLGGESGNYYARSARAEPSPAAQDPELASELWARSEQWCGIQER
jgi:NAD(P)-dependent dehydrogenase (short-subunit alcohol dehydrogenase family)